jgi:hypothetical protein
MQTENEVVERRDAGRRKAKQEAVEGEMVEAPARQRVAVVRIGATLAMTSAQIRESRGVERGFGTRRCASLRHQRPVAARQVDSRRNVAPEPAHAH